MRLVPRMLIAACVLAGFCTVAATRDKLERGVHNRVALFYDIARDAKGVELYLTSPLRFNNKHRLLLRLDHASFGPQARVDIVQVDWAEIAELMGYVIEIRRPSAPVEYQLGRMLNLNENLETKVLLSPSLKPQVVSPGDSLRIMSPVDGDAWSVLVLAQGRNGDSFIKVNLMQGQVELLKRHPPPNAVEYWVNGKGVPNLRAFKRGTKFVYEARYADDSWHQTFEREAEISGTDKRPLRMLRPLKHPNRYLVAAEDKKTSWYAVFGFDIYKGLEPNSRYSLPDADMVSAKFVDGFVKDDDPMSTYCQGLVNRKCFVGEQLLAQMTWDDMLKVSGPNLKTIELVDSNEQGEAMLLRAPAPGGNWNYFTFTRLQDGGLQPFPPKK